MKSMTWLFAQASFSAVVLFSGSVWASQEFAIPDSDDTTFENFDGSILNLDSQFETFAESDEDPAYEIIIADDQATEQWMRENGISHEQMAFEVDQLLLRHTDTTAKNSDDGGTLLDFVFGGDGAAKKDRSRERSGKPKKAGRNAKSCVASGGHASWYGPGFHGRRTACGQKFNQHGLTAAHKTLPCGTKVRVTHQNRSVDVVINDRGPFVRGRVIDVSKAAAQQLGLIKRGAGQVRLTVLSCG